MGLGTNRGALNYPGSGFDPNQKRAVLILPTKLKIKLVRYDTPPPTF